MDEGVLPQDVFMMLDSGRDSVKDRQKHAPTKTNKRRRNALDEGDEDYMDGERAGRSRESAESLPGDGMYSLVSW